jgi:4-hydroxybenzoate polyprenyltransferase/phosphoserine phosphatase
MEKIKIAPLVVDLDGTLTVTDTLHETVISAVKADVSVLFHLPAWLLKGKSHLKEKVFESTDFAPQHLPYRESLLSYIQEQRKAGRKIVLATAAYQGIAHKVAAHLNCFDQIIASDGISNLKGVNKLQAIKEQVGDEFIYAGDHIADIPIWQEAKGAIIAGPNTHRLQDTLSTSGIPVNATFPDAQVTLSTWLKAIRIHQWLKNLLLFVPLLAAFQLFNAHQLAEVTIAFVAFSLGASATYILNDLWDLQNDRQHTRKSRRPFASGLLTIKHGIIASVVLLTISLILCAWLSWQLLSLFCLYILITTLYSLKLKRLVLVDILTLSSLYTLRVFAGGIVASITLSYWLIAFSIFIFLSLATMKRCSELVAMTANQKIIIGRGYSKSDLDILWPLGISSFIGSIILFGLYINAPETISHYHYPMLLWLIQLILFYLLGNLWISTKRGLMHDDPIVYLLEDKKSLLIITLAIAIIVMARYFP